MENWQNKYQQEINQAKKARSDGNEGKARVCARRAAGEIVREYLSRTGFRLETRSAYDYLRCIISIPDLPDNVYQSAHNLLLRVDLEHQLPVGIDLVEDTERLYQALFGNQALD